MAITAIVMIIVNNNNDDNNIGCIRIDRGEGKSGINCNITIDKNVARKAC